MAVKRIRGSMWSTEVQEIVYIRHKSKGSSLIIGFGDKKAGSPCGCDTVPKSRVIRTQPDVKCLCILFVQKQWQMSGLRNQT